MEKNVNDYGQMNFNLPHDVVRLPSGGIFYPSKKKSLKVGYLTANDENTLLNIDGTKSVKETIILPLLRSKIYEPDIRPEDLTDGDIEAILIFLRNIFAELLIYNISKLLLVIKILSFKQFNMFLVKFTFLFI